MTFPPDRAVSTLALRPAASEDVEAIAVLWHDGWRDGHLGHVPEALHPHRGLAQFRQRVPPGSPRRPRPRRGPGSSAS